MSWMIYLYTFLVVFAVNLIPAFGPPTWMVLSFIAITFSIPSFPLFIAVAVAASSSGRFCLILFSKYVIRNRWLPPRYKKNIMHLENHLKKRNSIASGIFLLDAISPLPSDQLFVAYGLTGLKARYAIIPFIIGRIFTYSILVYATSEVSKQLAASQIANLSFFSGSFIIAEVIILLFIYLFVKIDWEHFIHHIKFRFVR